MAHADGEDQEGHQHRVRIQRVAQQRQQAELPHHGNQRAGHHQHGAAHAAGVGPQHAGADHQRHAEEHQHLAQPLDEIAHDLGETGHVQRDDVAVVLRAQRLDLPAQRAVVQRLAGLGIHVQQRREDDAGARVAGDDLADLAGALDIGADLGQRFGRAVVAVAHDGVAVQPLLRHRDPARVGRPQRLHEGPVHAGHQVDLVADLLQRVEVALVVDRALARLDDDAQRIALAAEVALVRQVVDDVGMLGRDGLLEAGIERQPQGLLAQPQRGQQAQQHDPGPMVEEQPLGPGAGAGVEVVEPGHHGWGAGRVGGGVHRWCQEWIRVRVRRGGYRAGWR